MNPREYRRRTRTVVRAKPDYPAQLEYARAAINTAIKRILDGEGGLAVDGLKQALEKLE